jgi:radical SAM superfamily enzyme YgiQ (UPF0313 family)
VRVLLINPPSPERLGAPLLGLQYVAASLLASGCEVKVIDAAARYFDPGFDWIAEETKRFAPDLTGFGLFTRWVWHAYALAERLKPFTRLMVAGGAHTTVRPDEVLDHGFDIAVIGEAEETIVRLVEYLRGKRELDRIARESVPAGGTGRSEVVRTANSSRIWMLCRCHISRKIYSIRAGMTLRDAK